jgi:uncharacterized protein YbjQ (UPF0145 family)
MTDQGPYRTGAEPSTDIIVTTGNDIAGHEVLRYLGLVRGIVVRAAGLDKSIMGAFKALGGGNIREYVDVCERARHEAYTMMLQHARELGAGAIIGVRYDATDFGGATEVLAYGTAVSIAPARG